MIHSRTQNLLDKQHTDEGCRQVANGAFPQINKHYLSLPHSGIKIKSSFPAGHYAARLPVEQEWGHLTDNIRSDIPKAHITPSCSDDSFPGGAHELVLTQTDAIASVI